MERSIAVITGGLGDIGYEIALKLGVDHQVFVLDHSPISPKVEAIFDQFGIETLCVDVSQADQIKDAFECVREYGTIRKLCCVAGGSQFNHLRDMDFNAWRQELSQNLDSNFLCIKQVLPDMIKATGYSTIINIASVNGMATFGHPGYSVAKAGLIHLTRFLAVEYGKHNIRAVAIAPGTVMTKAWNERVRKNPKLREDLLKVYPGNDLPTPQDVAELVRFVASDLAKAITGCCIPIDAGLTAGNLPMNELFPQEAIYSVTEHCCSEI